VKLSTVKFSGYRRFLRENTLKLSSKMTVLVGPNEAGKSSTLKVLHHLSHSNAFSSAERYDFLPKVKIKIKAEFLLDEEDLEAIGSNQVKFYIVTKLDDGGREYSLKPPLKRPTSHREIFKKKISKYIDSSEFKNIFQPTKEEEVEIKKAINSIKTELDDTPKIQIEYFTSIVNRIRSSQDANSVINFADDIDRFIEIESSKHPNESALDILRNRMPNILEFSQEDRLIKSPFNMTYFGHQKKDQAKKPCNTLSNLCEISGLEVNTLKENFAAGKSAKIASQFENANRKLEEIFQSSWSQSDVVIQLKWDRPNIHVMVKIKGQEEGDVEFGEIEDRSDGFRQYVALLAFVIKNNSSKPILLIDEAELHLHYDAQADFIQTFTERRLISQVVYTTHSAGCLPEDLGIGVKLVTPEKENDKIETSKIENNFWSSNTIGFNPLLYGMGAQTMAFFPTRRAVITEGQSEFILAPTIFRYVAGEEFNGFQVVPGFAGASKKESPIFSLQGTKVSYLFDNDPAGKDYAKTVIRMGVPENRVFFVNGMGPDSVITIEDWISDSAFFQAVDCYRKRYFPQSDTLPSDFFEGDGKGKKLEECEKFFDGSISKTTLSYLLLEIADIEGTGKIVNSSHVEMINDLKARIIESLNV